MNRRTYSILIALGILLIGSCSYKLQFVDVQSREPVKVIAEKLEEEENSAIVAHYTKDSISYVVNLTQIEFQDGYILSTPVPYNPHNIKSKYFEEANKRLKDGKSSVERPTRPSQEHLANQLHLYLYESDSTMADGRLKISNKEIDVIRDLSFNQRPPSYILLIVLGGAIGIALIIWAIWYLIFRPIGNAVDDTLNEGCYVATMVYGSYEADEVIILRKFRDDFLMKYGLGRQFIKSYYKYSPTFVRRHENKPRVRRMIKTGLNLFVKLLSKKYA